MKNNLNFTLLEDMYFKFLGILPQTLGFIVFLICGILIIWFILFVLKKILSISKIESLSKFVQNNELLKNSHIEIDIKKIILGFVKWFLILVMIVIGADLLGLQMVSKEIGVFVTYLPQLISALLIFVIGTYFSSQIKLFIQNILKSFDLNGSKAISAIVFYVLVIFVAITALNQAGVNTDLLSNNISFIFGAVLCTLVLALGLGSRDIVYRLLLGFYTKKNLQPNMYIEIDGVKGKILTLDNLSLVLETETETLLIPIKNVTNKQVKILNLNNQ